MQIVGYDTGTAPGAGDRPPALLIGGGAGGGSGGDSGDGPGGRGDRTDSADTGAVPASTPGGDGGDPGGGATTGGANDPGGDAVASADGRTVTRVSLTPGTELDYALGDRHCAGVLDGDVHRACPVDRAPYCGAHDSTWVCAKCTGTCLKSEMDCFETHAVYLAAFAPDEFKVGVTREWRLRTRLREQGADRGAHVHTVSNGRIARELEAEIADRVPVPDRVPVDRKRPGLARSVDDRRWGALLAEFEVLDRYEFDYGLDLARRPVAATLAAGRVRGVKGRLLVLDGGDTTYAVDLRELVGHEVREGEGGGERQTSLAAFR